MKELVNKIPLSPFKKEEYFVPSNSGKIFLSFLSFVFICISLSAQTTDDTLRTDDVIIIKEYEPTISDAYKIGTLPHTQDSVLPAPNIKYSILKKQLTTAYDIMPIPAAKMRGEPLNPLNKGYVKGGLGNYQNTLFHLSLNNLRSRKHAIGLDYDHKGSGGTIADRGFSGFSNNAVSVYGKKFLRKHLLVGNVNFNRKVVHYYGFKQSENPTLNKNNTKQRFNTVGATIGLKSFYQDSTKINHDINAKYYHLWDFFTATEDNLLINADFQKFYDKELIKLNTTIDYNNFNTANTIVKVNPQIISRGKKWRIDAGLRVFVEAGNGNEEFHFYPNAHLKYDVLNGMLIPYAGITGGIKRNSFASLSNDNPFINSFTTLKNTNTKYDIYGGVRGAFSSALSFNVKYSKLKQANVPLYLSNQGFVFLFPGNNNSNSFNTIYDQIETNRVTGQLSYQKTKKTNVLLTGEYNSYSVTNNVIAWYKPKVKISLTGEYNLQQKIVVRVDIFAKSHQYAKIDNPTQAKIDAEKLELVQNNIYSKKLSGIIDANLGLEYRYNKQLSAFLQFNNIASVKYQKWNGYFNQQFNMMGGITYSFWNK